VRRDGRAVWGGGGDSRLAAGQADMEFEAVWALWNVVGHVMWRAITH
jgi:hypothetical protein